MKKRGENRVLGHNVVFEVSMVGVFRVSPPPGPITQIEIQKIEEFKFLQNSVTYPGGVCVAWGCRYWSTRQLNMLVNPEPYPRHP